MNSRNLLPQQDRVEPTASELAKQVTDLSKPDLIAVVGATATGKTAVGVELALALDGEVVNGDSRLFYRGMDIATAKPTEAEMRGVPHHLIDILDPDEDFSLVRYMGRARSKIEDMVGRGKLPILVGGSGQYVWAFIEGWKVPEVEPNRALRAELERRLEHEGVGALARELSAMSPEIAGEVDLLNPRRVVRAIERLQANSSISTGSGRQKADEPPFNAMMIGLTVERSVLHRRVLDRLNGMLDNGWQAEVESLISDGYSARERAMSGIGYRQMISHLAGEVDLEETVRLTAVTTNRLIRQQGNWFKQEDARIQWFDMTDDPVNQAKSIIEAAKAWRSSYVQSLVPEGEG
jgi:tRNA dimethylallyltransferase